MPGTCMTKEKLVLKCEKREPGEKAGQIRREGKVPGVVYGPEIKSLSLTAKKAEFEKIFQAAGESSLIDLVVGDNAPVPALIKRVDLTPVHHEAEHFDLYQVNMKKEITAEIPLVFIGESKAVKELGGTLVKNLDSLEVTCLPADLVDQIEVDISRLESFSDAIRVKDLAISQKVEFSRDQEDLVASVMEAMEETAEETPAAGAIPATADNEGKTTE